MRAPTAELGSPFIKVTDIQQILRYDLRSTPGLVIGDKLVSSGRIPTQAEVQGWLLG